MLKLGMINYFMDDYHANHYPQWLNEVSGGEIVAKYGYAMLNQPPEDYLFKQKQRTSEQWCADYGVELCQTPEEVVEKSDVILINTPDYSEMHEILCQVPFRSGKPTFVDKTFAHNYATARKLADLAKEHGTPWFSSSALRYLPGYRKVNRDTIRDISLWWDADDVHLIHMVEPIKMLMDAPVRRLMRLSEKDYMHLLLEFEDGRLAALAGYDPFKGGLPMLMSVCHGDRHDSITLEGDLYHELIVEIADFFLTGKPKVNPEDTVEIMAIIEAGIAAKERPGQWIELKEFCGDKW